MTVDPARHPDWRAAPDRAALRALAAENARLREIERAAADVLDETDRILAVDPPPIKYRAPYGTLARLRGALARAALNATGDDNAGIR